MNRALPFLALLLLPPLLGGCSWFSSSKDVKPADVSGVPVETLYNHGVDALQAQDYKTALDQFDQVEQNYPYSTWASSAQLMQGYTEYLQQDYTDAIGTLDRYIQLHPANRDTPYAYYLRALSYYEQISDVARDQKATQEAMGALQEVINRYPDSAYARDARLKIDLCQDHLAGHEMEVGRFYEQQHLYAAAIGRYQRVVADFQTTNHVAEALARLTDIYLKLGLPDQARRTAAVLGANYPGSEWYATTYSQLAADGQVPNAAGQLPPPEEHGFFGALWHSVF
jgi:outer membrane protein assembly factor BamD